MFAAAPGPKTLVEMEGLDHNDPGLSPGPIWLQEVKVIVQWARENAAPPG